MWRQRQEARRSMIAAYTTARLVRATSRVPSLSVLLRGLEEPGPRPPQDPDEVRGAILGWAKAAGLKVERHEKPVI